MIKRVLLMLIAIMPFCAKGQDNAERDKIMAEAWLLYNSERASWHGSDVFVERYPNLQKKAGGYFSYTEGDVRKCIFFDNNETPTVLFTAAFDDSFVVQAAQIDTLSRKFTDNEKALYVIRQKALQEVSRDTLFKHYKNTSLNLIPVITGKEKKVYLLTGPNVSDVVVFGNDYLITFDEADNITSKRALHKNIIPIEYNDKTEDGVSMHNHHESTGELITATDVCTLMLNTVHMPTGKRI